LLRKKIFTPGPTQVHPDVLNATISFDTYHRSAEFSGFHKALISKLKSIFLTSQNLNILTTSGTGGLEAAVVNFCKPGDNVVYLNQGRFGARWGAIARAHGFSTAEVSVPYGETASIDDLDVKLLKNANAVLLTHSETSTATLTDIQSLTSFIKQNSEAIVIVDAVTSVGAIEFRMDNWNVDVAVSASQKGLMTQPGLAMIAYSDIAKGIMLNNPSNRFFFDLRKEAESQKDGFTTWTPAVGLFYGLDKACDIILSESLEKVWSRTHEMAEYFRNESLKNGFEIFSKAPSDSLTAITLPENIPTGSLIKRMKDKHGVHIANGQADLKNKIARFSHMGDLELSDFIELNKLLKLEFEQLRSAK
jgi:serine---pyruvate transaminase